MYVCMSLCVCVHVCICMFLCVCLICKDVKLRFRFYLVSRGRQGRCMAVANEAPCSWLGYGVWSAPRTCLFFGHSKGPSLEPHPQYYTICCTVVAIWNYFWSLTIGSVASESSSEQGRRKHFWNNLFTWSPTPSSPTVIYWLSFAETSPMILLLVYLFLLMSILNMKIIQLNVYFS